MRRYINSQESKQILKLLKTITAIILLFTLYGCASGSSIVTGNIRPAIKQSEVKLYLDPPAQYETIGVVEASGEVTLSRQSTQDRVINELKSQAAKLGANGVLLTTSGSQSTVTPAGLYSSGSKSDKIVAQGRAIYVTKE